MAVAYTDGACKGNPGIGGWGYILKIGEETIESCGSSTNTTNNKMELMAVIKLLRAIPRGISVIIHSDSRYVINGLVAWRKGWEKKDWKTSSGKPVLNKELWLELFGLYDEIKPELRWVKGHSGDPGNERADFLANLLINQAPAEETFIH